MAFSFPGRTQNLQEGTPEYECLKVWSTGSEYWKNKEYGNAVPYFWQAMDCDRQLRPDKEKRLFGSVFEKLADSYVRLKKLDSAIYVFRLGLKYTDDPLNIYRIGEVYHKHALQFDSAAVYYRKYYDATKSAEEIKRIAGMWVEAGKYKEALTTYSEYLDLKPDDQEIWVYILDPFKNQYKKIYGKDKWLEQCLKFSELFPQANRDFYVNDLLDQDIKAGMYDRAIKTAREILAKDSTSKVIWVKLGDIYDAKQDRDNAIASYEKAVSLDAQDPDLLCKLARVYLDNKQFSKTWSLSLQAADIRKFGQPYFLIGITILDGIKQCSGNVLSIEAKEANMVALKYFEMASKYPDKEKDALSYASVCRQNGITKSDSFMGSLGKLKNSGCYGWMLDRDYYNPFN